METLLVKIFATALALSQVTTAPERVETRFDRTLDQPRVAQLLRAGCTHMRKAFDIENINLDELITTAMDDPQALPSGAVMRGGIKEDKQSSSNRTNRDAPCHELCGPSLCERGARPFRDVRHRGAWRPPRGDGRHVFAERVRASQSIAQTCGRFTTPPKALLRPADCVTLQGFQRSPAFLIEIKIRSRLM